jgi:hypothetical protein
VDGDVKRLILRVTAGSSTSSGKVNESNEDVKPDLTVTANRVQSIRVSPGGLRLRISLHMLSQPHLRASAQLLFSRLCRFCGGIRRNDALGTFWRIETCLSALVIGPSILPALGCPDQQQRKPEMIASPHRMPNLAANNSLPGPRDIPQATAGPEAKEADVAKGTFSTKQKEGRIVLKLPSILAEKGGVGRRRGEIPPASHVPRWTLMCLSPCIILHTLLSAMDA